MRPVIWTQAYVTDYWPLQAQHSQYCFHLSVCCVSAGSSIEFVAEAESTDRSQPFEIKTEYITEHDDKPRPYLCTVCDKRFTTKQYLNVHSRIHNVENLYSCSECEKCFLSQNALRCHKYIHTGRFKCTECGKCFGSSSDLARHLQRHKRHVHSNRRLSRCPYCAKMFKTDTELKCHVYIHTDVMLYSCKHCSECLTSLDQLRTHLLKSHNEGNWFVCNNTINTLQMCCVCLQCHLIS